MTDEMTDEFMPGASDPIEIPAEGVSRRRFLTLLGASAALAAGTSCSNPDRGTIVPYTRRPQEIIPGVANYYASTFQEGLTGWSVLVKTREGRPIHLEGNDQHPLYKGKAHLRAIADILRLYDPDRLRQPLLDGRPATWAQCDARVVAALKAAGGSGRVLLVTGALLSPTRRALVADLAKVVAGLRHIACEPLAEAGAIESSIESFGEITLPRIRFDRAEVIASFGSDFLGSEPSAPVAIREFASRRRVRRSADSMNRLWVVEGNMTVTGANADHRLAVSPSASAALAFALARTFNEKHGLALPADLDPALFALFEPDRISNTLGIPQGLLDALAFDLVKAGRNALVLAGRMMPAQLHTACALLNQMLGSEGHQDYGAAASVAMPVLPAAQAARVFAEVKPGDYSAAILWGVNPAYWLPNEGAWRSALSAIPLKVFIGLHQDETAQDCQVVLPEHHWLEAWGDCEMPGGPLSLQQPAIGPLYDSRQGEEILLGWIAALGGAVPAQYRLYLMERWKREVLGAASPVGFESFWNAALHDGVHERPVPDAAPRVVKPRAVEKAALSASKAMTARSPASGSFELLLVPASAVWDGRYANNGWLQEMPDPVTKATWSNPAAISVADAKRLGVRDGDVLRIEAGGRSVEAPAIVQPGQAAGVISLALGYGRRAGSVAGGIGVNAWPLAATGDAPSGSPFVVPASVAPTGGRSEVPQTQTHHRMEGRDIVRSVTMVDYARAGAGHEAAGEMPTLYPSQQFPEHKWGMAIDLAACVGCSGCVVACQSENNIAVVGPEQVLRGREMHWIRIDRYYEGDPANPAVVHQPMLCQQCDNAPCENVCPVNATNHSPDGLNQMIYNRCVGTRYCANNCPYKVRRFNFLEFTAAKTEPESLVFNPEVTVRPRGVMEKCTFCVQRIQDARQRSGGEGRSLRDGEIVPACAAACPAQAIVFGDLKDPSSEVSRLSANDRGYKVLAELGVKPSITYLSKLTNPAGAERDGGHEKGGGHHEG